MVESISNIRACSSSGLFWAPIINQTVGTGAFAEPTDAFLLGPIIRALIALKKRHALASADLLTYRLMHALTGRLLEGTVESTDDEEPMEAWMASMRFASSGKVPSKADRARRRQLALHRVALQVAALAHRAAPRDLHTPEGADRLERRRRPAQPLRVPRRSSGWV